MPPLEILSSELRCVLGDYDKYGLEVGFESYNVASPHKNTVPQKKWI